MILKSYLFSQTSNGYQQYTKDHSETFLKDLCKNSSTSDQIAIHRSGNLAYYAYAHKNANSDIYGICVVCGEVCLNLQWLYDFFKRAIDASAKKGVLFYYSYSGEIIKKTANFSAETAEVDSLFRELKEYLDNNPTYWEKLPPEDFSIPLSSKILLSFKEDHKEKITEAVRHYHNIMVTMENAIPTSYARTVERLNKEKVQLTNENNELKENIEDLHREKKQYRWVAFLSLAVIASLIGLYFLNDNLSSVISDKEDLICYKNDTIAIQKNNIAVLRDSVGNLESSVSSCQRTIRQQEEKLVTLQKAFPIIITDIEIGNVDYNSNIETNYGYTIYSRYTMYLKPQITYIGINTWETITLKVKWYTPNGNLSRGDSSPIGFSQSEDLYICSGSNTKTLGGWGNSNKGFWSSGTYRIEIWYEDVCLRAENFTIY